MTGGGAAAFDAWPHTGSIHTSTAKRAAQRTTSNGAARLAALPVPRRRLLIAEIVAKALPGRGEGPRPGGR
ncbi:hypothetical protein GCM10010245_21610 [Streptomyces spectabilis]|nr:hypothetical protein GCM10010245_21610 [Streptomyces spectabilis]